MALSAGTVSLGVRADTEGLGASIRSQVIKESGKSKLGTIGKVMGGALVAGIGAGVLGIGTVIKTGVDEMRDASLSNAQLSAGIKSTGGVANVTLKQMNDLAASIQAYSGQTDDSIAASEQLLLTFTSIRNVGPDKIFDDATRAAADMAARLGGDAASQSILLGKALNDPIHGVTSLMRVGVSFSAQQRDQIKAMVGANNTIGAQKLILGELNKEFGGSAKAVGESVPGALERGKRAFEDMSQSVVEKFLPIVTPAISALATGLQKASPVVIAIAGKISSALQVVGPMVRDAFAKLAPVFGPLIKQFAALWLQTSPIMIIFRALRPLLPQIAQVLGDLARTVGSVLAGAFKSLMPAITQIGSLFGGLVAQVLPMLLPIIEQLASTLGRLLTAIVPIVVQVVQALMPAFQALVPVILQIVQAILPVVSVLVQALMPVFQALMPVIQAAVQLISPLVDVFKALLTPILGLIKPLLNLVMQIIQPLLPILQPLLQAGLQPLVLIMKALVPIISGVAGALGDVLTPVIKTVTDLLSGLIKFVTDVFKGDWSAAWKDIVDIFTNLWNNIGDVVKGVLNGAIDIINGLISAINGALGGLKDVTGGAVNLTIPTIPHLAQGATVLPTMGGTLVRVAEGGRAETVVDTGKVNALIEQALNGGGRFPDEVTLVDANGSLLARLKVMLDNYDQGVQHNLRFGGGV